MTTTSTFNFLFLDTVKVCTMTDHELEIEAFGQNDDFWIFGYGYVGTMSLNFGDSKSRTERTMLIYWIYRSLIWKPPPHYGISTPSSSSPQLRFPIFASSELRELRRPKQFPPSRPHTSTYRIPTCTYLGKPTLTLYRIGHTDKRIPGYIQNYVRRFWQV